MEKNKKIAVDFDGVISNYQGWGSGKIDTEPVKGVYEGLKKLKSLGYIIMIYTTRTNQMYKKVGEPEQLPQVEAYLIKHGLIYDEIWTGPGKPMFHCCIDDRNISFNGDWVQTIKDVESFNVWNRPKDTKSSSEVWIEGQ